MSNSYVILNVNKASSNIDIKNSYLFLSAESFQKISELTDGAT